MEANNEINNKLIESIRTKDYQLFNEALKDLYLYTKNNSFKEIINYIKNIEFTEKERVEFYIYTITKTDESKYKDTLAKTFRLEIIPCLFYSYTEENQDSFYKLLVDNKEILKEYIKWFKINPYIDEKAMDLYKKIFNLEEFKKEILKDNEFISNNFFRDYNFFKLIPDDFGYLIALYDTKYDKTNEKITDLYNSKITNKISHKDKLELVKTHYSINTEPNIFGLSTKEIMLEFEYCLKHITEDVTYFQIIKELMNKTGLNMKTIMKFASKYDNDQIFKKIYKSATSLNKEIIDKIKYLASEKKVKDTSKLNNIEEISIEELKKLEKEKNNSIKVKIQGGPHSKTTEKFFKSNNLNYNREIIRIDSDGYISIKPIRKLDNHDDGVKSIYYDIIFPEECNTAITRALYASKQLSSITIVTEMEMGYLVMPSSPSQEQINSICKLLDDTNEQSIIGIISYDAVNDKETIAFDGACVTCTEAKNYLLELNEKKHLR